MKLDKEKADLSFELQRATSSKEQAEAAARTAREAADEKLKQLLEQLEDSKHSNEAVSTTSQLFKNVGEISSASGAMPTVQNILVLLMLTGIWPSAW